MLQVTFFEDGALKEVGPGRCLKGHESDVLAMAVMDGHPALATACDDGTIWIWNVDSGNKSEGSAENTILWLRFQCSDCASDP